MRIEIFMVGITILFVINTYYNGFIIKWVQRQKKFIQIAGIIMVSFSAYLMIKRHPEKARTALLQATNYVKYMPVNKSTVDQFSNIFDFTTGENDNEGNISTPPLSQNAVDPEKRVKRSVSETKKKYVASMQDWKCGSCHAKLSAWFEVDHKKRLEYGGSNNVDNLVALCRECHGQKTAMENM